MDHVLAGQIAVGVNQALGEPIMIGCPGELRLVHAIWSEMAVEWEHGLDGGRDVAVNQRHVMATILRSALHSPMVGMTVSSPRRGEWKVVGVQTAAQETWELTLQECPGGAC